MTKADQIICAMAIAWISFVVGELVGQHWLEPEPIALHCIVNTSNELMCALDCETPGLCDDDSMLVRIYERRPGIRHEHQVESGHITAAVITP